MMDVEEKKNKAADRKARAILKNQERAQRTDLEQLILLHSDPRRGCSRR